jgi:hypothetical protein
MLVGLTNSFNKWYVLDPVYFLLDDEIAKKCTETKGV